MVAHVRTVCFQGVEATPVDVQVHMGPGRVLFNIVGLGDKAVTESRERVRAALAASGLALPAKRITAHDNTPFAGRVRRQAQVARLSQRGVPRQVTARV